MKNIILLLVLLASNQLFAQNNGCDKCLPTFSPESGSYIVTAWVATDESIEFGTPLPLDISITVNEEIAKPQGPIIDGWQRIYKVVTHGIEDMTLKFSGGVQSAYFDDLRIYPLDAQMKSYVYNDLTLKLMAQLDENNFATFYEYNEEGQLIRVKRETEKGVVTLQESRTFIRRAND